MAGQGYSSIAALVVAAFLLMALAACASTEQRAEPVAYEPGAAEFHDADIGDDTLRSRLPSE